MQGTKNFPFCPGIKVIHKVKNNDYMKKIKPKNFTKAKKLKCDSTDKNENFSLYRMLKFFVRHRMIVEKIHEIISFEQNKWLGKYKTFNTQKRHKANNEF